MLGFDCLKQGFGGRVMLVGVNYDKDAKGESIIRALLKKCNNKEHEPDKSCFLIDENQ